MNVFNYNNAKILNSFYSKIVGHNVKYVAMALCRFTRGYSNGKGSLSIYDDNNQLIYTSKVISNQEKLTLLYVIPYISSTGIKATVIDDIGFRTPIVEDICKNLGWVYQSPYSTDNKTYNYMRTMNELYGIS